MPETPCRFVGKGSTSSLEGYYLIAKDTLNELRAFRNKALRNAWFSVPSTRRKELSDEVAQHWTKFAKSTSVRFTLKDGSRSCEENVIGLRVRVSTQKVV